MPMELRCHQCSANLTRVGFGKTYICGHSICYSCYYLYRPPECSTCQIKPTAAPGSGILKPSTQNHVPHTQTHPHPQPIVSPTATQQFQTSASLNPQPHVSPSAVSHPYTPPCNTPQPSTTLFSTVQCQQTWGRPSAPEESGHQNSTQGIEGSSDVGQMLFSIQMGNSCFGPQQGEQDSDVGQSRAIGNVKQLMQKFESQGVTAQEGATGWKNQEENARTPQGSSYTSRQQNTLVRHKEPQGTQSNTPSLSPPSEGHETPQQKRHHSRGQQPYPHSVPTKDRYITNPSIREPVLTPLGSTDTFPPPGNIYPSSSTSSTADRHSNPPRSSSRPREPSTSSSGATDPSRSSSRNRNLSSSSSSSSSVRQTNPSRSSRTRDQSPSSINAGSCPRSSSRNRDPLSSHLRGRISSSPSPTRHTDHSHSLPSPRDPSLPSSRHSSSSLSPKISRKSPPPSKHSDPSTSPSHSSGAMFPGTHSKGRNANSATSCYTATHEPQLKQALTSISTEDLTFPRAPRPITSTHKHEEELAVVKELSLSQQNQVQEQMKTLIQENTELKEEMTALREAKDAQEKETSHWKAEYDKQQKAAQEEMQQLRMEECRRQQEAHSRWEGTVMDLQIKITTLGEETKQYREKNNILQNELQGMTEEWAKQMAAASYLKEENTQYQNEKVKLGEEVRHLKQEMSAKCAAWEEERNLNIENLRMLEVKVASLEERNSSLIVQNMQSQEELAALRTSKKNERRSLIRERDTCQEEADKLKKDKETLQEKMSLLRKERNDHHLTIQGLEYRISQFSERMKMLPEIDELKRKKAALEEEATHLRHERDQYKEKVDQLKTRAESELTYMRQERDKYKEEADQLKGRPNSYPEKATELSLSEKKVTELQQERDRMEREIDQLKQKENTTRGERDEYEEKADNLKRKLTSLENQMAVIRRERDDYKGQIDECKAQYDKIIHLATERNNYKIRGDEEGSMIALLQQDIHSCKMEIKEHKRNETALEDKITMMRTEKENQVRCLEAQIKQLQQDKERVDEYERSEAALKKKIKQMERDMENQQKDINIQIAQLKQEKDGYEKEVKAAKRKEATLENQLKQMRDKSSHEMKVLVEKRERESYEYRQKVDQLMEKNYELEIKLKQMTREKDSCKREAERRIKEVNQLTSKNSKLEGQLKQVRNDRDTNKNEIDSLEKKIDSYKRENDVHKQEIDHLNTRQDVEVTWHRQGTDQHLTVAERLGKQSAAGDARPREAAQSERDPSDFLETPTHSHQHRSGTTEVVDVEIAGPEEGATFGLREKQSGTHWVATQGLPNLGNTCYINSVVQCLYHLPPLRNTLATCHRSYHDSQSGSGVALALAQLFGAMQTSFETEVRLAARELKVVLGTYDATFRGREQQEAHDLFTALVSCLHSDLSQHGSPDTSPSASSLFGGKLETSIVCLQTGAPLTRTSEAFTSLSLPVVEGREWFLKDLLEKHFMEQVMDWDCERCRCTHSCSHSTHIHCCPPLLVIHFSRVTHYNSTRKVKVNFPVSGLDLQRYVAPNAHRSPRYQLVGVVCHAGSMAYGHYTAYCRYGRGRRSGMWRLCSDMQVWDVEEWTVLEDENAHMLFYVQQ